MSYLLFSAASVVEYVAVFTFMFALFRFQFTRRTVLSVLAVSIMLSQISYFTREISAIGELSTYIQLVVLVIVLWMLFQVPIFYSIVMSFAAFAVVVIVQGLTLLAFDLSGVATADAIKASVILGAAVQIASSLIEVGIAYAIKTTNIGFNFVPTSRRTSTQFNQTNIVLLIITLTTMLITGIFAYLFNNEFDRYVFAACCVFILTVPMFVYYALRRDTESAT